ncbi:PA2779 family protein [Oceanisphaera pacifica]|uniref:PA2779 family protein n=1 Tax=Oceanisphaera pacifica TaxID=2818389 RepID=A0ABS3NIK0_9GAMM|nr:PA2779 family protein [Oceanisphaera pacifica]MBO1520407.1 PA2779 family protein [Oceanisphaera pacifica]
MKKLFNVLNPLLILSLMMGTMPIAVQAQPSQLVSTQSALDAVQISAERERINDLLARTEVQEQLVNYGVEMSEVEARVAAMSDQEVLQMADQLDNMPAGANAVIGALLTVFIVLLITDLLGLTNVYPFTR